MTAPVMTSAQERAAHERLVSYNYVGYGRPPRHTQFRKGQSGNPGGRPRRRPAELRANELLLDLVYRGVAIKVDCRMEPMAILQAIMRSQIDLALNGDYRAQRDIIRAVQQAELMKSLQADQEAEDGDQEEYVAAASAAMPPPESDEEEDEDDSDEEEDEEDEDDEDDDEDEDEDDEDEDDDEEDDESGDDDETGEGGEPGGLAAAGAAVTEAPDAAPPVLQVLPETPPRRRPPARSRGGRASAAPSKPGRKSRKNSLLDSLFSGNSIPVCSNAVAAFKKYSTSD